MKYSCGAALLLTACGYSSQYLPPTDGRPRAVWVDDHVEVEPAGAPLPEACAEWLAWASHTDRLQLASGELRVAKPVAPTLGVIVATAPFWVPRFYGPAIVVATPTIAPALPVPPLFLPRPVLHPPGIPLPIGGTPSTPLAGAGGSGRGAEVLAAIAIVIAPALAVGLAASRPEDTTENAAAIDQVNAYNDLLRSPGSPCAVREPAP